MAKQISLILIHVSFQAFGFELLWCQCQISVDFVGFASKCKISSAFRILPWIWTLLSNLWTLKCLRIYCLLSPGAGWPDCSTMEHGATEVCPATRRLRRPRMRWAHALTQNLASCREGFETKRNRHCRAQARAWWPWGFLAEEYRWGRQWRQWNVFHLDTWTRSWKMTKYDSAERPLTGRDQQSIRKPYRKGLKTGALSALFCGKIENLSHLISTASEWERVWKEHQLFHDFTFMFDQIRVSKPEHAYPI